ncbi:MAG TPA: phycobiliprotein lyase [Pseudanabaena sp.]|nr:phycobiliprotein lyase [Pseudanabaena sp.]
MDIHQFLELFVGRWRSQRSDHQFGQENGNDGRSLLEINALSEDDPDLITICQKYDVDPLTTRHAVRTSWEEESLSSIKPKGSALIVPVPNPISPHKGLILSKQGKGIYEFAQDESLTIHSVTSQGVAEERIWYGNPNLRFRVATVLQSSYAGDRRIQSSKFYSEIRISRSKQ